VDSGVRVAYILSTVPRDQEATVRRLFDKVALLKFAPSVPLQHERSLARRATGKSAQR
jgi:hypothetical protein